MNRKFLWHSFTDSRRPSAVDQRLERQAQQIGSFRFPRPVMFSEDEPNGKKRCSKGDSCGATCIFHGDECLKEFPEGVQKALKRYVESVVTAQRSGEVSEEQVKQSLGRLDESFTLTQAKEITKAFERIDQDYKTPEERDKAVQEVLTQIIPAYTVRRDKTYKPSNEEMAAQRAGMERNKKYIERLDEIEEKVKKGNLSPEEVNTLLLEAKKQRQERNISEAQLDLAWALLPKAERDYLLNRAGSPSEAARYAKGQGTMEVPKNGWGGVLSTLSSEERLARAKMGLKTYSDEGGRDMYSGIKYPITRMEWEHTIAVKNAGKGAETGANTGWTLQTTNRTKSDGSPSSVFKVTKVKRSENPEEFNRLKKQAAQASALDGAGLIKAVLGAEGMIPKDKAAIIGEFFSAVYGVPKTFIAGSMTSGRASSRRTEWMKTPSGQKLMVAMATKVLPLLEKGDIREAERLADTLKKTHETIVKRLEGKVGGAIGSAGSTEVMNKVLAEALASV